MNPPHKTLKRPSPPKSGNGFDFAAAQLHRARTLAGLSGAKPVSIRCCVAFYVSVTKCSEHIGERSERL